jgi:hypothetical protein
MKAVRSFGSHYDLEDRGVLPTTERVMVKSGDFVSSAGWRNDPQASGFSG